MAQIVWFRDRNEQWRTGVYQRTIEKGSDSGLFEVRSCVEGKTHRVPSDQVEFIREGNRNEEPHTVLPADKCVRLPQMTDAVSEGEVKCE